MQDDTTLRLRREKMEALRELARARLGPPERDRVLALLDAEGPADSEVIRNAQEKATQAAADRAVKRRPYEADPLFMYLWRRRFNTRDYTATGLVCYFDRKVAQLIGYERARVNYAMLMALPDRLQEHVERLKQDQAGAAAVEQHPQIAALVRAARENPGREAPLVRRIAELDAALAARQTESGPDAS